MIGSSAFTVFVLGMRHGADPDHLAAIDNVTRNAYVKTPLLSRFVGTFFAGGHSDDGDGHLGAGRHARHAFRGARAD